MSDRSAAPRIDADEIARVFGGDRTWRAETLVHNPRNEVTGGIWRVSAGRDSAILKVVTHPDHGSSALWSASDRPRHWNYWRREALVYSSDLLSAFADAGIGAPTPICIIERTPNEMAVWLEDVAGRHGDVWELADHCAAARALGRASAMTLGMIDSADYPWLSRGFLRDYSARPVEYSLIEDDVAWQHALVSECLGPEVRESGRLLLGERDRLLGAMESLPRTLCHLDFWPMNLIRRPNGEVVAVDWAFVGEGAIGEDLGNHVPDSAFDGFLPAARLTALDRATFAAFAEGLREAGWTGDPRRTRLGVCASAVKYAWLLPLMLRRALDDEHHSYGGAALNDPADQYRERGATLNFLAEWIREALRLERVLRREVASLG